MQDFKKKFLEIVTDSTDTYRNNNAAVFLCKIVKEYADMNLQSYLEAAEELSEAPDYSDGGYSADRQIRNYVEPGGECIEMTLEQITEAAKNGGGPPDWWDPDWETGLTDEEVEEELAELKAFSEMKLHRFMSFFTGSPLVKIEYAYDGDYVYELCGNKIEKAAITEAQYAELNSLGFEESIRAAYVFDEASGGSNAPI